MRLHSPWILGIPAYIYIAQRLFVMLVNQINKALQFHDTDEPSADMFFIAFVMCLLWPVTLCVIGISKLGRHVYYKRSP